RASVINQGRSVFADPVAHYSRRLGWYALVRAIKPKIVVETGVDQGLGACVLTAALMKNHQEGYAGYYYGTELNLTAGYLLHGAYKQFGTILYGDSLASLEHLQETINIFINDSDHAPAYESREYEVIKDKLDDRAILLGDNAHVTDRLFQFARATGRQFIYFQ